MATLTKQSRTLSGLGHSLLWPLLFLLFCGWVIELAGISALQASCSSDPTIQDPTYSRLTLQAGTGCSKALRWVWWILWFEFPVFIGLVIVTALGIAHPGPWLAWSPLLAVVTALQMIGTNVTYNLWEAPNRSGKYNSRAKTAFAGFIITSIANCLLMLAIGMAVHHSYDHSRDDTGYVERRTTYTEPVGTTTATRTAHAARAETEEAGVARVV
eukprot:jgi/Botrbrau1/21239/Bobra.39_2s0037.1